MEQIERQKKTLSMLITMHSLLREKYLNLAAFFEMFLLVSSVILNALIFVDNQLILSATSLSIDSQKIISGVASIAVFSISIILLQVNWKEKAARHSQTVEQLFILLQDCRMIAELPDNTKRTIFIAEFEKKYTQVSSILAKIPDGDFNSLKLRHYRKIELSKMIDRFPSSFLWILKIRLFLNSLK